MYRSLRVLRMVLNHTFDLEMGSHGRYIFIIAYMSSLCYFNTSFIFCTISFRCLVTISENGYAFHDSNDIRIGNVENPHF